MNTTTKNVQSALAGAGALAMLLGLILWTGNGGGPLRLLHMVLGGVLVLGLFALAAKAARRGAPTGAVVMTVALGLVVVVVGVVQKWLLLGGAHWVIQLLHVLTSIAAMASARRLLPALQQQRALPVLPRARPTIEEAAAEFLSKKRIAVTGVSRKPQDHGSNVVFRRLHQRGYAVFAVNPNADEVEGVRAFRDLASIPGGVDAVLIGTRPEHAMATMRECVELGVGLVWMHRGLGAGSVSNEATAWGRARGIRVIDGGCPLMFEPTADAAHKVMRCVLTMTGKVPRHVA
jgi:predicted CoA-binding protein